MSEDGKKELTQGDWDNDHGLLSQLQQERLLDNAVDLGSILDMQGFSRQIKGIRFSNFSFHNFTLEGLEFYECNFSERDFRNTSLSHVQFVQCNFTKVKWLDSVLTETLFRACTLSYSEIIHSAFKNVSIKNSMLSGSYWNNAQLSQLHIHNSVLNESVFYATSIHDSSMSYADLQDVFWIQNIGEFLKTNCTITSTDRPMVGMAWDFLQRGTFSPIIDDVLRDSGAIVLKIEMQSKLIDAAKLSEDVVRCLSDHSESTSSIIARKLFCKTLQKPEKEYPDAIHNKGIYQLFFSKILQYRMLSV